MTPGSAPLHVANDSADSDDGGAALTLPTRWLCRPSYISHLWSTLLGNEPATPVSLSLSRHASRDKADASSSSASASSVSSNSNSNTINYLCPDVSTWSLPREPYLCGLLNPKMGNLCYINSVLQCLAATRPLTIALWELRDRHNKTCPKKIANEFCMLCVFN